MPASCTAAPGPGLPGSAPQPTNLSPKGCRRRRASRCISIPSCFCLSKGACSFPSLISSRSWRSQTGRKHFKFPPLASSALARPFQTPAITWPASLIKSGEQEIPGNNPTRYALHFNTKQSVTILLAALWVCKTTPKACSVATFPPHKKPVRYLALLKEVDEFAWLVPQELILAGIPLLAATHKSFGIYTKLFVLDLKWPKTGFYPNGVSKKEHD